MPFGPSEIVEFLAHHDRKEWDSSVESIALVSQPTPDVFINYIRYKKVMMISSRDILIASKVVKLQNGTMIASTSIEHNEYSPADDVVRANIDIAGYYIQPSEQENMHQVLALLSGSFGGNIPNALAKKTMEINVPKNLKAMNVMMQKIYQ